MPASESRCWHLMSMQQDDAVLDALVACLSSKAKTAKVAFFLKPIACYDICGLELAAKTEDSISSAYAVDCNGDELPLEVYDDESGCMLKRKPLDMFIASKAHALKFSTASYFNYWRFVDVADLESSSCEELALKLALRGA